MAGRVSASPSAGSFEYDFVEAEPATNKISPWIDPGLLKLRHRIGRGPFGDVWIATQHQSTEDYDEYHEVAVKVLCPINEDQVQAILFKFEDMFSKCQEVKGVCSLHGISIISGKVCIVMRFYEGSVGDKMAHLKGGKLSLPDLLRYGIDLALGILELHMRGILVLNLKPSNFLLDEHGRAVIGDFGIPSLLHGIALTGDGAVSRVGTPNYMAPEQWQPDVRGPLSFETDSWGFGCSIVEMFSGVRPWCGRSAEEIYNLVVTKQEKPTIPHGLPPIIENIVRGCFESDFRNRPLIANILQAFQSCQNAVYGDKGWINVGNKCVDKPSGGGYTEWFILKNPLQVGDTVRSRKSAKSCKPESMAIPEGMVVGLESEVDRVGFVLVRVHGIHDPLRVQSSTLERVTSGFAAGDWVRVRDEDKKHSPVGILHSTERDGRVTVGFVGMENLWRGNYSELQMAESYCVGQFVRLKANVFSPRFGWPHKGSGEWFTGRISQVLPNGCLTVRFPGRLAFGDDGVFLADPAEVEVVSFSTCKGLVKKYQHLEDFHWSVRPFVIALGFFTALKLGFFIGKNVGRARSRPASLSRMRSRRKKGGHVLAQGDVRQLDGQDGSNAAWLPPSVANILFREGVTNAR